MSATTTEDDTPSGRPLVIVESPAKAKTITKFLGNAFDVRASVGHIADLPSKGLAVDVDNDFVPNYELTERGKQVVRELKAALKDASALYLATDEDREGEAISWHLLQRLRPKVPVRRMVFHEITAAAIQHAVDNPRDIDEGLVDAAETRRILDRLYGYEVSPVLWRRVNRGLSAGRVQSPTIRLIVEREQERIDHISADYWDIDLDTATTPAFTARLVAVDGTRVATGRDFDDRGVADTKVVAIDEARARALADGLSGATITVRSVEEKPYRSSPRAPFMTSTLQQEGGRRLRLSSSQVMRIAQGLYERGFITYMRTDNTVLSDEAMSATRAAISTRYGDTYLSSAPKQYTSSSKNAQEAHEAIRPTTPFRPPEAVASELNRQDLALYTLIWQRTLASQMADARGVTVSVRLAGTSTHESTDCEFAASGTTITFPGHRAVLEAVASDGEDASASRDDETLLPELNEGDTVPVAGLTPNGHTTSPPARFTEASLVKRLEELGIGRPSTWASIIQTVQDRGYVWKKGQALVPTWTAFAVVRLLEDHFPDLVDYELTATIEADLDAIAEGQRSKNDWLKSFYWGDDVLPGLKRLVEENLDQIDAAAINTFHIALDDDGVDIVAKPGRYGPYIKRGEDTVGIPDDLPPDELTRDEALRLLSMPKSDEPIGEWEGLPVFAKNGRYGPYVQWGTPEDLPPGLDKPKMSSLFSTMSLERITIDDAIQLLQLPRTLGVDPNDGGTIEANNGRYGPYVVKNGDFRTIDSEEQLLSISLDDAVRIFQLPKVFKRGARAASGPLRTFGDDPVSGRPVVARDGRFGVYVTDGETNASIGKGDRIEEVTPERAFELLAIRRDQGPSTKKRAAKKTTAKKTAARKTGAKKRAAKKSAAKKD